jgi:energy-coupling factor transport system substrate-specific component
MTTATLDRDRLWEVSSRTIVYSAIGAALYGILLVAQIPIPGSTVSVRPAFALVPFFGYAFGPIVGSSPVSSAMPSVTRSPAGAP